MDTSTDARPRRRFPPRMSPGAFRVVSVVNLVLVSAIVVTGAAVRLTGSGLGCPDWPTCEGTTIIDPSSSHALIESGNRAITGLVSLGVIVATLGALVRDPRRRDLFWLSLGLVGGIVLQIVIGGIVVILELSPLSVIAHFMASMVIVWCAAILVARSRREDVPVDPAAFFTHEPGPGRDAATVLSDETIRDRIPVARALTRLLFVAGSVVLTLGTFVTGSGPHSGDEIADRLGFGLSEITRLHSIAAWALVVIAVVLAFVTGRGDGFAPVRNGLLWVFLAIALQITIGYVQYFNRLPAGLVGLHVVGATLVWIAIVFLNTRVPSRHDVETVAVPPSQELTAAAR